MTIDQFINAVSKIDGWYLQGTGIRKTGGLGEIVMAFCPITAVHNYKKKPKQPYTPAQFDLAGRELRLKHENYNLIALAADYKCAEHITRTTEGRLQNAIRRKLLKACKLKENQ